MSTQLLKHAKVNDVHINLWQLTTQVYEVEVLDTDGGTLQPYHGPDLLQARVSYANQVLSLAGAD